MIKLFAFIGGLTCIYGLLKLGLYIIGIEEDIKGYEAADRGDE